MLQLVLGVSGTGKTGFVLASIKARALVGRKSILLTPEQFSSSSETMLHRALGDALGGFAESFSFTSLAENILKRLGGVAVRTLTEPARVVAVRRAMDTLGDALEIYARHRHNTSFCALCADAIHELKTAGALPENVLHAAESAGTDGKKLHELGLIFGAYEKVIAGSAMDPADRIVTAAQKIEGAMLADVAVFVDGFDGFTAPEYRMLEQLVQAELCTVTLCCDSLADHEEGFGLFSPVKQTAQRLLRIAAAQGVTAAAPRILAVDHRHRASPVLRAVGELLVSGETTAAPGGGFFVTPAAGLYAECKNTACRIAALVRQDPSLRYADIAVICRQLDEYAAPLQYEFALAGIPCFSDETESPEHTAPAAFFRAALDLLSKGLSTEVLLRLLKTDLCGIDAPSIAALENYAYTWDLRAADWRSTFEKDPAGFGAQMTDESKAALARLEETRASLMERVQTFLADAKASGTAAGISQSLYAFLLSFGGDVHTQESAAALERSGDALRARAVYAVWNNMMALLEQMDRLLGADAVTPAEYAELFALLLHSTQLGKVPQTQDAVLITTADRMRLNEPKVCFVLGVSEGHFPRLPGASGLLSHTDRDLLVREGVEMPGSYEKRTLLEQMFFYRALTSARDALYVSHVSPEYGGAPLSAAMELLTEKLAPPADALPDAVLAPTPADALDLLGARYREDSPVTAAIEAALAEDGSMADSLRAMRRAADSPVFRAHDKKQIEKLLGKGLSLSPTRIEQYFRCHFAYFLQYMLRLSPVQRAELSPVNSGNLVHFILEKVLRETGGRFPELTPEEIADSAEAAVREYVDTCMGGTGERFSFLVGRICAEAVRLLRFMQTEQRQSGFHPVAFEQEIGWGENAVPPLRLHTQDGHPVSVRGKIDRVDKMEGKDGVRYLRVLDYKTGSRSFRLEEVYCGLNTQMLLYLFTLCPEQTGTASDAPVAAGVLYLMADPAPQTGSRTDAAAPPVYHVDGLVLDEEVVLRGMDAEDSGLFAPSKRKRDGRADRATFGRIQKHLIEKVREMANGLYAGEIDAAPLCSPGFSPCGVCAYRPVCLHEDGRGETYLSAPKSPFAAPVCEDQATANEKGDV